MRERERTHPSRNEPLGVRRPGWEGARIADMLRETTAAQDARPRGETIRADGIRAARESGSDPPGPGEAMSDIRLTQLVPAGG